MDEIPEPAPVSTLQSWALKTPDWTVDARILSLAPLLLLGLVAFFFEPALAGLLVIMLLALVSSLSIEPLSGFLLILVGPAVALFFFGTTGAIVAGAFILFLVGLGLFWTLRSIRYEMRRASRLDGR